MCMCCELLCCGAKGCVIVVVVVVVVVEVVVVAHAACQRVEPANMGVLQQLAAAAELL